MAAEICEVVTDADVERARQGDAEAGRRLVEGLYPVVLRIVRGHRPVRTGEADLAQEVFLKIFARLDRYQPRAGVPFVHWVSRVAVRTCLDLLRAERRRPERMWSDLTEEEATWLEYLLAGSDENPAGSAAAAREVVRHLLGRLPPADSLVLTLLDLEERSVKEISALTGWSVTSVKVRAFRARQRLRRVAEQYRKEQRHEHF
ncbi:MAG TPA: RNA polymerase sigma factor [Verrucomicrobiota bacterium]|nr:RNA polymerase sigma factor [Verrucomicrobiota bacterium]HNU50845.1 RNA polymerase sigma factor [Verrucomicrobiota bacterium]